MNYYIIKVKMGHVGRNKYLPMDLAIKAKNGKEAAMIAKNHPGVKRNHKDWCLTIPKKVSLEKYLKQVEINKNDPYWNKETRRNLNQFKSRIVEEKNYKRINGIKTNTKIIVKKTPKKVKIFKIKKNIPIEYKDPL